jgi:outer membrane protein assembly factor BamB
MENKGKLLAARFLLWLGRGALAAAGLCVCLIGLNYLALSAAKPFDSEALAALKLRLEADPADSRLAEEVRALDLLARKSYFISRESSDALFAAALALACLGVAATKARALIVPDDRLKKAVEDRGRAVPVAAAPRGSTLAVASLVALALIASLVISRDVRSDGRRILNALGLGSYPSLKAFDRNWPSLRGNRAGVATGLKSNRVPFDPGKLGVSFRVRIDLPGFNSPVLWGGRVFLTGGTAEEQAVYAFDSKSGKILWRMSLEKALGRKVRMPEVGANTGVAAPTAATDGKRVFVMFASGQLLCLKATDGSLLWYKDFGVPDNPYGIASSPLVVRDAVYVQFDQSDKGLLAAFLTGNGRLLWEAERKQKPSWASPVAVDLAGRPGIIFVGNPFVEERDAETGKLRWSTECMSGETAPSAAVGAGGVFAATSLAGVLALSRKGEALWESYDDVPDISSPLCAGDRLYMATSHGTVSCLSAKDGSLLWREKVGDEFSASPILASGKIFLADVSGFLRWFDEGQAYANPGSLELGGELKASPAFGDGAIFLRSSEELIRLEVGP